MPVRFCGHCGQEVDGQGVAGHGLDGGRLDGGGLGGEPVGADPHAACEQALRLEPPRFCAQCRRRMVVQVTPTGWTARCSRHGEMRDGPTDRRPADGPR